MVSRGVEIEREKERSEPVESMRRIVTIVDPNSCAYLHQDINSSHENINQLILHLRLILTSLALLFAFFSATDRTEP